MAIFLRDSCGIFTVVVTWTLALYSEYAVLEHALPLLAVNLHGAFHGLLFSLLVFLMLWSHVRAIITDPGRVPLSNASLDFSDLQAARDRHKEAEPDEWSLCDKCEIYRPPRAHHCRVCRRCIRRMDHHCPWVNNCVGEANLKFFLLFLIYTGLACLHGLGLSIAVWVMHVGKLAVTTAVLIIMLMIICLLFGLFCFVMLVEQVSAIHGDITAIERLQRKGRVRHRKPLLSLMAEVFGNGSRLGWPLPCVKPKIIQGTYNLSV